MKKSIKAALLSAFVLPGAGHFFLHQYKVGSVLAIVAFAGLYSIVVNTLEQAQKIADKILSGEIPADLTAISDLAAAQTMGDPQHMNLAMMALIISWCVGIVDAYRVGRKLESHD